MTLNERQSPEDSLQKIKIVIIQINYEKISKTMKNSTVKPQNFSL